MCVSNGGVVVVLYSEEVIFWWCDGGVLCSVGVNVWWCDEVGYDTNERASFFLNKNFVV